MKDQDQTSSARPKGSDWLTKALCLTYRAPREPAPRLGDLIESLKGRIKPE